MNSRIKLFLSWVFILILQVFIFSRLDIFGFINPFIYIFFLITFDFNIKNAYFLIIAFIYGLVLDLLLQTSAIHAISCLFVSYFRPYILQLTFGRSYKLLYFSFYETRIDRRVIYITTLSLLHHFIIFSFEYFSFAHAFIIFRNTLFTLPFTVIIIIIYMILSRKK